MMESVHVESDDILVSFDVSSRFTNGSDTLCDWDE